MISETAWSSQTKFGGSNLHVEEQAIGYLNFTPDPKGAQGALGVKIQVSPNQKTLLTKVAWLKDGKNCISPSGRARKTCKGGFLVLQICISGTYGGY